jgi:hypothetical protein
MFDKTKKIFIFLFFVFFFFLLFYLKNDKTHF